MNFALINGCGTGKIMFVVITNKVNKQGKGKICYFTIDRDHSNKK